MKRNPQKQWLALILALLLGLLMLAAGSRDEFPGRRQGGGSRGNTPEVIDHGA